MWVHGSLALGDFQVGRSDFDLVAVLDGPIVDPGVREFHRSLEKTHPLAEKLHCSYMQVDQLADASLRHPTWAQQRYFDRPVGAVTRRELALGDRTLFGPPPSSLLPATTDEELAAFIRDDLEHFWYPATRKLTPWYTDIWVDLGLITVARAGVTLTTGHLITKQAALSLLPSLGAPSSVVTDIHHRRYGPPTRTWPWWRHRRGVLTRAVPPDGDPVGAQLTVIGVPLVRLRSSAYVVGKTECGIPAAAQTTAYCSRAVSTYVGTWRGVADRGDAADRLTGVLLDELRGRAAQLADPELGGDLRCVDPVRAGRQDQHRGAVAVEDQAVGDRADLAPELRAATAAAAVGTASSRITISPVAPAARRASATFCTLG